MKGIEYSEWHAMFLEQGLKAGIPSGAKRADIEAWAHSMALIADQLVEDNDGAALVDA